MSARFPLAGPRSRHPHADHAGAPGRQELYEDFLRSADQSNREQIVEAMERSGLMASLVASYGEGRAAWKL